MVRFCKHIMVMLMLPAALQAWAQSGQTVQIGQGGSVVLRANAQHAIAYLWFQDGSPINGHHDQRITVSEAGVYTVIALGDECHSDVSDPVEVIVDADNGNPIIVDMHIRSEPDRPVVLIGSVFNYHLYIINNGSHPASNVVVSAVFPSNVNYENVIGSYLGGVTYSPAGRELTWIPGKMDPGQSATLTIQARAVSAGQSAKLAVVTHDHPDETPHDNEASALIHVMALKIPNTFTPNGDGLNDYFEIPGLAQFPEHRLTIFNRWGNEIFRSRNYQNNWNGSNLGEGTYYYVLELKLHTGRWETFKGFVTIIRN